MDLSQYRDIFGAPRTGLHAYRLFDIAIVDAFSTILVAIIISALTSYGFVTILIALFAAGIVVHRIFHVNTTIGVLLFGKL